VREIVRRADDCAGAVVSAFVDAVMAGLADHHTIVQVVGPAKPHMFNMVGLGAFKEFVLRSASVTNVGYRRSAGRAKVPLPLQGQGLCPTSEFLRPSSHPISFVPSALAVSLHTEAC
jgi:hypothetical protein